MTTKDEQYYKQVPLDCNYHCRKCSSLNVEFHEIDNDYGDIKYHCKDCDAIWYYEGGDY